MYLYHNYHNNANLMKITNSQKHVEKISSNISVFLVAHEKERVLFHAGLFLQSMTVRSMRKIIRNLCDFSNDETCHQRADKQTGHALNC